MNILFPRILGSSLLRINVGFLRKHEFCIYILFDLTLSHGFFNIAPQEVSSAMRLLSSSCSLRTHALNLINGRMTDCKNQGCIIDRILSIVSFPEIEK